MSLSVDVDVEVQVHHVKVVARDQFSTKLEQLRERDVIARSDSPFAFVQWLVPARGSVVPRVW